MKMKTIGPKIVWATSGWFMISRWPVKDLICVEKYKNPNSQLCEALNATDEKAENFTGHPDHYVSRNCADICNLSN